MVELYKKNEIETNETVSNTILLVLGFIFTMGIFCWTGIFDIYNYIINGFILASVIPLILPIILVNVLHINKRWVKYVIITCVVIVTGISYVFFTFQTVIIFIIPSIIATFYLDSKVMYYTGIISVLNIVLAHLFTCFYLFQPWIEPFQGIMPIMLYGALSRIMQYLFSTILLYLLCKRFIGFFNGFYIVFQDEEKTLKANNTKTDTTELNIILERLTEREREVFELLVQGSTNAQIANQLCLSNGTVKNYVSVIYDKIGMKDRTALILRYSAFYRRHD